MQTQDWITSHFSPACFAVKNLYGQFRDEFDMDKQEHLTEVELVDKVLTNLNKSKSEALQEENNTCSQDNSNEGLSVKQLMQPGGYCWALRAMALIVLIFSFHSSTQVDHIVEILARATASEPKQLVVALKEDPFF